MYTHVESSERGTHTPQTYHLQHDNDPPSSLSPQHHNFLILFPATAGQSP